MRQLHFDAAAAASLQHPTIPAVSSAHASAPTSAVEPPPTPAPPAHTAMPPSSEETSQATPTARGSAGVVDPSVVGPRGAQSDRSGAGRLAPVAESRMEEHATLDPQSMDRAAEAAVAHSAAHTHSAVGQGADAGRNASIPGCNLARQDATAGTPGDDPSCQLQFGQPLHPSLPHSGVSVMSHGQNTHANAVAAGYRQFSHGGDARPLHY
eukprot:4700893-Pleurochrysis_carterae.AAC.2